MRRAKLGALVMTAAVAVALAPSVATVAQTDPQGSTEVAGNSVDVAATSKHPTICVTSTKVLKYTTATRCPSGQKLLVWNKVGPKGATDPQGPQGPAGERTGVGSAR